MKIAVLGLRGFPGVQGGVEAHCENLYRCLAKKGCKITVFMRKSYVTSQSHRFSGIEAVPVSSPKNKYLETIVHTYKCIWLARRLKPDIVHIHAIGPSVLTPLVRAMGMRVVVTNHGPDYKRKKWLFFAKLFLRFCEWVGMTCANDTIAIAQNIAEDVKRRFSRDAHVIPNGVDIPQITQNDQALKKFGLEKRKYILAVGRLVPEKGFDILVDAFNKARFSAEPARPWNWKLAIVGQADFEDQYSLSLRQKTSNDPNIVLTGFLTGDPLRELYSQAGLFVLPSYHEGLPIVLLEAMSYGLSCIASDIPANRNIELADERFFKPGDIETLSLKITQFINKPLSEEERAKQIRMIAKEYDWDKIAGQTLEVYQKIVEKS